eukprot:11511934-Heterocapsa_arctica.AAC.1
MCFIIIINNIKPPPWKAFQDHLMIAHPKAMLHVIACERERMCGGLRRLLRGDGFRQVATALNSRPQ